jgi:hypothetical protein
MTEPAMDRLNSDYLKNPCLALLREEAGRADAALFVAQRLVAAMAFRSAETHCEAALRARYLAEVAEVCWSRYFDGLGAEMRRLDSSASGANHHMWRAGLGVVTRPIDSLARLTNVATPETKLLLTHTSLNDDEVLEHAARRRKQAPSRQSRVDDI